ncbi:hypothetical protein [Hydrogenophaga sp.]|uniref:hypothetical protein n=1 Tax=Hydrogenophaga sp. TaxID=1904254 RepID=UPI003F6C8488
MSPTSLAYLRFLNLIENIKDSLPELEGSEQRLLNLVALAWHSRETLTVTQAMNNCKDLSAATVHRRIQTLASKGMLSIRNAEGDQRIKYIEPTVKAIAYMERLSKLIKQAGAQPASAKAGYNE